jgi:hypothetical protein
MRIPSRLPLPEPAITCHDSDPNVVAHLQALNAEIQKLNTMIRDAMTANKKTGVLIIDDGVNYKVTITFTEGTVTTAPVVEASSGLAGASWT